LRWLSVEATQVCGLLLERVRPRFNPLDENAFQDSTFSTVVGLRLAQIHRDAKKAARFKKAIE
jgi:hypothetical protein